MDTASQKKQLRTEMKEIMSFVSNKAQRSELLLKLLLDKRMFKGVKILSTFITLEDEVDTLPIVDYCWENGITVTIPEFQDLRNEHYVHRKWARSDHLYESQYGIFHTRNPKIFKLSEVDLILVPGLAFTKEGDRLGRGKGFYDRMLSQYEGKKVGICFQEQIKKNIPCDSRDIKVDSVIAC